jgi:hypothetical protein
MVRTGGKRRASLLFTGLLGWWSMTGAQPGQAAESIVTFDFAKAHAFGGFGLQIWGLPQTPAALSSLLQDLAIRHVRMGAFPNPPPSTLTAASAVSAQVQAVRSAASPSQIARWSSLGQELRGRDIDVHLVIWQAPLPWRIDKPWTDAQGHRQVGHLADPSHMQESADYICAQLLFGLSLGFPISFVELSNEPDGAWGTRWTPNDYAQFVVVARHAMNEAGLSHVAIEGPGTGTERTAGPYLAALKATGAFTSLGAISVHDWDTRFSPDPVGLTPQFQADAQGVSRGLPVHVTELNDEALRWKTATADSSTGRTRFATDSRTFAIALAQEALKTVGDGATETFVWEAEDLSWEKAYLGLVDEHGQRRPAADALAAFFPLISGLSRVAAGTPPMPGLEMAAFLKANELVVVMINSDAAAKDLSVKILNAHSSIGHLTATRCYAADGPVAPSDCAQPTQVSAGEVRVSVPRTSILTMVFAARKD